MNETHTAFTIICEEYRKNGHSNCLKEIEDLHDFIVSKLPYIRDSKHVDRCKELIKILQLRARHIVLMRQQGIDISNFHQKADLLSIKLSIKSEHELRSEIKKLMGGNNYSDNELIKYIENSYDILKIKKLRKLLDSENHVQFKNLKKTAEERIQFFTKTMIASSSEDLYALLSKIKNVYDQKISNEFVINQLSTERESIDFLMKALEKHIYLQEVLETLKWDFDINTLKPHVNEINGTFIIDTLSYRIQLEQKKLPKENTFQYKKYNEIIHILAEHRQTLNRQSGHDDDESGALAIPA